jgi:diguanylate cyclase (GGDEF)-like protein
MRRLIMSPFLLGVVVLSALAGVLWLTATVEHRTALQLDAEGRRTAGVIAVTVVQPSLDAAVPRGGRVSADDIARMRAALAELRRDGALVGLGVWRLDGTPVFLGDRARAGMVAPPSATDLRRAASDRSWTSRGHDPDGRATLDVTLAMTAGGPGAQDVVAVVRVVLPREVESFYAETDRLVWQRVLAVVLIVLPVLGLFRLQRRWRERDRLDGRDALTGLPNRHALHDRAPEMLAGVTEDRPLALLLIDLRDFKYVNDTLGHSAGDLLLQQVAATLGSMMDADDLLVRLGGDEFAIVTADLRDAQVAQRHAQRILQTLRQASFTVQGMDLVIDASIGIAMAPQHGADMATLLQRADVAMYQAKRENAGAAVYDARTDPHTVGQLAMVTELRRAVENQEFVLYYQPKVSLPGREVTSVEALLRWQHPTRGLLAPDAFLTVLESSGLIQPVTRWVLREAVRQAARWRAAGMPLPVAININPRSLLEADLPARVLAVLSGADLPASFLELEITETAVMTDPRRAATVLAQLAARGVRVAIDDFGAGYTSLAHLRSLPIAALKLDRSLVSQMMDSPEDHAVTETLIALAHRLGLSVVAEGVETEDVLQRLTALGCDEAQGYFMSVPLPPAGLERWAAEHTGRTVSDCSEPASVGDVHSRYGVPL